MYRLHAVEDFFHRLLCPECVISILRTRIKGGVVPSVKMFLLTLEDYLTSSSSTLVYATPQLPPCTHTRTQRETKHITFKKRTKSARSARKGDETT